MENEPASPDTYVAFVELLRREFADRFTDLRAHSRELMLFSNPSQVEVDESCADGAHRTAMLCSTESDIQGGATSGVLSNALAD